MLAAVIIDSLVQSGTLALVPLQCKHCVELDRNQSLIMLPLTRLMAIFTTM